MSYTYPLESSPPILPSRRPCLVPVLTICILAILSLAGFLLVETSPASLPTMRRRTTPVPALPERRADTTDFVTFGLWDEGQKLSPLQVTIAVSIALGEEVFDEDVFVSQEGNHFFKVKVQHGNRAMASIINHESFVLNANEAISSFGGMLVLTREAVVHS